MVENCESEFLDAYQCQDWSVKAQKFAELFLKELKNSWTSQAAARALLACYHRDARKPSGRDGLNELSG